MSATPVKGASRIKSATPWKVNKGRKWNVLKFEFEPPEDTRRRPQQDRRAGGEVRGAPLMRVSKEAVK